jgi:hypothetical protein
MAESQRKVRLALADVGHHSGVQLDVGSANADPLDVDQQLIRHRHEVVDFLNLSLTWSRDDECPHQRRAAFGLAIRD